MPRREIESLENEIRSLSRRIDDNRQHGSDGQTLAGIERALGEIREVLRSLTPAEQLTGYDEAIRNLGAKLDLILRSNDDPSTVQQLESAIAALRGIVSNVASNDALARLAEDVHTLSAKVDQLRRFDGNSDAFGMLEQRLAALTSTLETRQPPAASDHSEYLESALRTLSERLDRIPVGNDNASAFAHLEQRVSYLLERLEASDIVPPRPPSTSDGSRKGCTIFCVRSNASTPAWSRSPIATAMPTRRSRWTPASSIWSSANCPTSASASRKPTAARRTRSRPFTARSATWSIACRRSKAICARFAPRPCAAACPGAGRDARRDARAPMPSQAFAPPPSCSP